jgi:hypothetical protein
LYADDLDALSTALDGIRSAAPADVFADGPRGADIIELPAGR